MPRPAAAARPPRPRSLERRRHQPFVDAAGAPVDERARILAVAGEQLVAAFAGEHDLDVLARQRRHEVQRHARRVRDRLVFVPDEPRQRPEEVVVVDDDFVAVGADGARDLRARTRAR